MKDFGRGLIAGVAAGFVFAIVYSIISIFIIFFLFSSIAWTSTAGFVNDALIFSNIGALLPNAVLSAIVVGLVFGLIYAAVYKSLLGSTSVTKGVMLGTMFWLVFAVFIGYIRTATHYGMIYYSANMITGLLSYLVLGYFAGKLWDKLGGRPGEYQIKKEIQRSRWKLITVALIIIIVVTVVAVVVLPGNRITIETSLDIPVSRLPIYRGNSTPLIEASFTFSNDSYENCPEGLCFLVENGEISDFPKNYSNLKYSNEFVNVTHDESIIIDRIKKGEFACLGPLDDPQYPMRSLGDVTIFDYEIIYYNETLYKWGTGEGMYIPAYILYAETSNWGSARILVWATSQLRYEKFP